ncbi:MAG: hypothetical protein MJ182_04745 [Treponema sp.]|nr:hypothetical protein [Treponema sp.]
MMKNVNNFSRFRFLFFQINEFIKFILRLFFTSSTGGTECVVCGGTSFVMPICKVCRSEIFYVKNIRSSKRCSVCGKPLISEDEQCMECRNNSIYQNTNQVFPMFEYRLWNKELLFLWKIQGVRSLTSFFAEKIHDVLFQLDEKYIVPVPPRKGKIARKGWDQIEDICGFLEKRYGFCVLRILKRNCGPEQKKLGRESRIENIGKSFSLEDEKKLKKELKKTGGIFPESCCLIDDILTTGSTAESCASVLKKGGIKKVDVLALFTAS